MTLENEIRGLISSIVGTCSCHVTPNHSLYGLGLREEKMDRFQSVVDSQYKVTLTDDEVRLCNIVGDLVTLVDNKVFS